MQKKKKLNWSDERTAQLRLLWGTHSTKEIAEIMGISTDAVTGRATRCGLPSRNTKAEKVAPKSESVTFSQLNKHHCRYILASGRYCGKRKQDGSSYCPEHKILCTQEDRIMKPLFVKGD